MKFISIFLLLQNLFTFSQTKLISIVSKGYNKPLIGIQLYSDNGSFIGNSDTTGNFIFDIVALKNQNINSILFYGSDFVSVEYKIDNIPSIIVLETIRNYNLETVVIIQNKTKAKYTVKAFFRSWQLLNGKLIKYGDGIIDYHVPYADVKNNFATGVKSYKLSYRTFKGDSLKQKLKQIKVPTLSGYLGVAYIPKNDILKRNNESYEIRSKTENLSEIYETNRKVSFVKYNSENIPTEIFVNSNQENDEVMKGPFRKVYGKWIEIEKWTGNGNTRHPTYIFYSGITTVLDNKRNQNYIETVKEIFIQDDINTDDTVPNIYKSSIEEDKSFYKTNYWDEYLKIYPLPSKIQHQLIKVNENKNNYQDK